MIRAAREGGLSTCRGFTYKWLYRPGKANVANPLSRSPGVVAAMLPVAGPEVLCRCAALHCEGPRQQMTLKFGDDRQPALYCAIPQIGIEPRAA